MYRLFDKEKISKKEYLEMTSFGKMIVPLDFWNYLVENKNELNELLEKFKQIKVVGEIKDDAVDNDGVVLIVTSETHIIPFSFYLFMQLQSIEFLKIKNNPNEKTNMTKDETNPTSVL
jgi:hypothetical protein